MSLKRSYSFPSSPFLYIRELVLGCRWISVTVARKIFAGGGASERRSHLPGAIDARVATSITSQCCSNAATRRDAPPAAQFRSCLASFVPRVKWSAIRTLVRRVNTHNSRTIVLHEFFYINVVNYSTECRINIYDKRINKISMFYLPLNNIFFLYPWVYNLQSILSLNR